MSKIEKLLKRFMEVPADFSWDELIRILNHFGFEEIPRKGKSSGSRRKFVHSDGRIISLHQPHPENIVKKYVIRQIIKYLE